MAPSRTRWIPQFAGSSAEINIAGDLMVGLTTLDAAARPIPGIAQGWTVSPDGLIWTFHLRPARWSDGAPVTAGDFVFAWRRLLAPATAARNAELLFILKNARAISAGRLAPMALGVAAPDASTLVLTLEHPAPWLPQFLAHPAASPLPAVAAHDPHWARPGRYVSDGPYLPAEWVPNDHVRLEKNPRFYDAAHVAIQTVNYFPTSDAFAALMRLRGGGLDMQTPLPMAQIGWMRGHMPAALHIMPSLGDAYVAINLRDPLLTDVRVRRALNLAYDRDVVAAKVMRLGEAPAWSIVPPATANYAHGPRMDFATLPASTRLAQAQSLMRQSGYGPDHRLRLALSTTGNPDSKRLATVFQAMMRPIFVDIDIEVSDLATHLRDMRSGQFQLGYTTWLADVDDGGDFLNLLRSDNGNNYAGYHNPRFDAAMDAADREPDVARRAALLMAAERIALTDLPWIPLRFLSQTEAVAPKVQGYVENARDYNRSRWLRLR